MPETPKDAITRYGPRKLGEEEFERQQARKALSSRGGTVYGPRKAGAPPETEDATEPAGSGGEDQEPPTPEVVTDSTDTEGDEPTDGEENPFLPTGDGDASGYTTIEELEAALEQDPTLLDLAIEAEFDRDGGPRKGAARALLDFELEREDGPREEVVTRLEQHV